MEAGGWTSPAMLKRYVHLGPSRVWQAVEKLAEETGVKLAPMRRKMNLHISNATP